MSSLKRKTITKEIKRRVKNIDPIMEEKYKEAFDMFDTDGSGEISANEIRRLLKTFGQDVTRQEAAEMIKDLDTDQDGSINFEEFITLMTTQVVEETIDVPEDDDDEVIRAFRKFDFNNSGTITLDEFNFILTKLGERWTENRAKEVFKFCDLNNDGELDYKEFVHFWRRVIKKEN